MADDERNDPPWGKPLEPGEVEGQETRASDVPEETRVSDTPDETRISDTPDETVTRDAPGPTVQREVQMGQPEGEADPPDMEHSDEEIPDNIIDQTREGEHPYQWHSGLKRDHGSTDAIEFIDVKKSFG